MSTTNDKPGSNLDNLSLENIEEQLKQFEIEERKRLGLPVENSKHWFDAVPREFTRDQREHTTILVSGLTMAHDLFIQSALRGIGYKVLAMDTPDNDALQYGREYGNRGQCNPTYFTVGNLVKYLDGLRERGMTKEEIVKNHVFVTAGACGPCRFGTYVTEYRKALRDSGFDGFRVLLFQQTGGLKQATGDGVGLEMNPAFFWGIVRAILIGDTLNALGYRIRPYEVEAGAADRALEQSKKIIADAFENNKSLPLALYKVRRVMGKVKVDRTKAKPRVGIIGEFWAMTTEGDGNYGLQRFLEAEGAEPDIQIVTAWLLYMIWQGRYDTQQRATLRGADKAFKDADGKQTVGGSKFSLAGVDVRKRRRWLEVQPRGRRRPQAYGVAVGRREGAPRSVPDHRKGDGPGGLPPAEHERDRRGLARVLRQQPPWRRRPHGDWQADPERRLLEGQHDPLGEAVRLHAELVGLRRYPVVHHRALSAGHLPADRDQR